MKLESRPLLSLAVLAFGCLAPPKAQGARSESRSASSTAEIARSTPNGAMIFLMIGQSNMVGAPAPEPADQSEDARISVLAYEDCPNLGRSYNQWYPAKP